MAAVKGNKKKRSLPRRLLRLVLLGVPLILLVVVLLVGSVLLLLHTDVGLEQARRLVLHFTRDTLPGLQVKRITGGITSELRLDGIVLKDIHGGEAIRARSLRLRYDLTRLWDKKIVVQEVVLDRPRVTARYVDGVLNLGQLVKLEPKKEEEPPSGPLRWTAELGALRVLAGAGSFQQGDQRYTVEDLHVDLGAAVDLATLKTSLDLTAIKARAAVPGQPELKLDLRGKARWDGKQRVDVETVLSVATLALIKQASGKKGKGKKVKSIIPVAIAPNRTVTLNLDAEGPLSRLEVKLGLKLPEGGTVGLGGRVGLKLDDGFSLGPYTANLKMARVNPAPLVPELELASTDLNLGLTLSGAGIPLQPGSRSKLVLDLGPSSVLAYKVDSLLVRGGLTGQAWKLDRLLAKAWGADLRITGQGTLKKITKSRIKLKVPSLARLPLPRSVPFLGGAVAADLSVAGPMTRNLSISGAVTARAVAVAGIRLGSGKVSLDVSGLPYKPSGLVRVEAAGLRTVKGKKSELLLSRGAVKISGHRQRLVVEADVQRPDLRAGLGLTASLSAELPPKKIDLRLHRLSARHKKLAVRLLNRPKISVQLGRQVIVEPLRLAALGGQLGVAATYRLKAQPRLEARVQVKKIRPVTGPPMSADITALLDHRALSARLRADVGGANRLALDARVPVVYRKGMPRPSRRAPLALHLRAPKLDLGLVNRFAPRAPRVGGTVGLDLRAQGTLRAPRLDLALKMSRVTNPYLSPLSGKVRVSMGSQKSTVRMALAHGQQKLISLDAGAGVTVARLLAAGSRDLLRALSRVPASAKLTVHATPLTSLAAVSPLLAEASGTVAASVDLSGSLQAPRARARLQIRDGQVAGQRLGTIIANAGLSGGPGTRGDLSLHLGKVKLVQVSSVAQKSVLELMRQKDFTTLPFKVTARFPRVKLSALKEYHRLLEIAEGTLDGEATVEGSIRAPRADARFSLTDTSFNRRVLGDVTTKVAFDGRTFGLGLNLKQGKKGRARAAVSFDLKDRKGLRASLDAGHLDIGFAQELVPALRELSGKLHARIRVSGDLKKPAISGSLRLQNVRVRVDGAPTLEQVNARVRLSRERVRLVSLSARSGRGLLTAKGQVDLEELRPKSFALDARSTLFDLGVGPLKNSAFFGNLGVKGGLSKDNLLTADVRLRNGSLRLAGLGGDRKLHSTKPLPDVVLEEKVDPRKKLRPKKDAKPAKPLKLKIKVVVEPMRVHSDDFDLQAETDVRADTGPRGKLRLGGWAGLLKGGTLSLMGSRYTVERAKVRFQGKPEPNPTLDVVLTRQIQTVKVFIAVGGSARAHKISFKSDPPSYTESQIISMIATGRMEQATDDSGDEGGGDQKMTMANAMANALIGTVAGKAVAKVGLDVARVNVKEQEDENEEVQLQAQAEVGKYLTKDLYVGYRRIFGATDKENENEGILEYTFLPRWLLSAHFGDAPVGGVDVFWTYRY